MNESADENDARKIFINLQVSDLKMTTMDFLPNLGLQEQEIK
jgi:predicted lactoylglutathione lyase